MLSIKKDQTIEGSRLLGAVKERLTRVKSPKCAH